MSITDTSKHEFHPEWLGGGNPEAIEAQEARGQGELCGQRTCLPTKCIGDAKEALEQAGIVWRNIVQSDPLFTEVTLPDDWSIVPYPDHAMWSSLIDGEGKKRASIFYKAAFYDRDAFVRLES